MKLPFNLKREIKDLVRKKLEEEERVVYIISSQKLSDKELSRIKSFFPELKGAKLSNIVDPKILAGFKIKIGTRVYDFSLKSRLESLKRYWYENIR